MLTLPRPAGAVMVKSPAIGPSVSATVLSPSPAPGLLVSGMLIVGAPSVCPLMVMVRTAVVVLPSPSVRV